MSFGELKEVKTTLKEKEVYWTISNLLTLSASDEYLSSTFKFLGASWKLILDPSQSDSKDHIAVGLHLAKKFVGTFSFSVKSTFCIKKVNGSFTGFSSFKHTFHQENDEIMVLKFCTRSDLVQHQSELMPSSKLTIVCILKLQQDPVKLIELDTLSENINHLHNNEELCDITLHVKEKEFKAHRVILAARSPVFAAMFKHDTSEKLTGIINIPDCAVESFQSFLDYLYCGKLENIPFRKSLHLYRIADKYDVPELKMFCLENLEHNLKVENIFDVVLLTAEFDEKELHTAAQDFFNRNIKEIFESAQWKTFIKNNFDLANKLLKEMTYSIKVVETSVNWIVK